MLILILGSAGIGLVWGWLVGSFDSRVSHLYRTIPAIALATFAISGQILWFHNWRGLTFFLGATLFALFVHVGWRRELRNR